MTERIIFSFLILMFGFLSPNLFYGGHKGPKPKTPETQTSTKKPVIEPANEEVEDPGEAKIPEYTIPPFTGASKNSEGDRYSVTGRVQGGALVTTIMTYNQKDDDPDVEEFKGTLYPVKMPNEGGKEVYELRDDTDREKAKTIIKMVHGGADEILLLAGNVPKKELATLDLRLEQEFLDLLK